MRLAIGWTLIHSLWEGAILSAALAAALLPIRSARVRYAAACAALLLMLGGFGFTLVRMMPESPRAGTFQPLVFRAGELRTAVDTPGNWEPALSQIASWLAPFWIAGVFAFYIRHVAGLAMVYKLRRKGVCYAPARWQPELARLSALMRLSRPVLLLESCLAETPIVLGHFRPVILMPVELLVGLPAGQIEAILLHELAHVRRHDYMVNVLQRLIEGLLFYHPAVWWISRIVRAERENCCDDVVVSIRGNAHEYALALAALEQNRGSGREPALAATGGSLVTRIRRLLYSNGSNDAWTPVLAAVILITTLTVTLAAWQATPQPNGAAESPYSKWLNQDVLYIVSDAERAVFQRLVSDEERVKFIEQFWERRKPAPGTTENAGKVEHYRRIAYANERYRPASGTSGWRSDRGRMYIVYGPPDEIESHPKGGPNSFPFEVWLYRNLEGIGNNVTVTFVDRTGDGNYQLAPGKGR